MRCAAVERFYVEADQEGYSRQAADLCLQRTKDDEHRKLRKLRNTKP